MDVRFGVGEQTNVTEPITQNVSQAPSQAEQASQASQLPATTRLVLGDKIPTFDEIILPRINIVQNIGMLKDSFDNGSLVLNQQTVLFVPPLVNAKTATVERAATPPVVITVLGFKETRFCEKIVGGTRGLIVNTEEEVRKAGGTLDYNEWMLKKKDGMKRFEQLSDALCAIEKPEALADDDTVFVYPVNGKKYALALWALRGVNYTAVAKKVFFTARSIGCLREGYPTYSYNVTTREETYPGGNKAWVGVCIPNAKSTPEFLEFATNVLDQKL